MSLITAVCVCVCVCVLGEVVGGPIKLSHGRKYYVLKLGEGSVIPWLNITELREDFPPKKKMNHPNKRIVWI